MATSTDIPVAGSDFGPWTKVHEMESNRSLIQAKFTGTREERMVVQVVIQYGFIVKPRGFYNVYENDQVVLITGSMLAGGELKMRACTEGKVEWITVEIDENPRKTGVSAR